MIESTEARLQSHYEHIDRQLKLARPVTISEAGVQSRHAQIMEEMNSTRQCLGICTNVSARLEELRTPLITQSQVQYDVGTTTWPSATIAKSSEGFTVDLLNSLHNRTSNGLIELRRKLKVLEGQSHSLDGATGASKEDFEKSRMRKEREDVVQLLEICSAASEQAKEARTNIFEDIGAGDDANQIIVSTVGDLVSARRITAGARSIQMLGQVADETVLQVSRSGRSEFEQRSNNK